jgi:hypothetical protein
MDVRRSRLMVFGIVTLLVALTYGCTLLAENGIVPKKAWFASWLFTLGAVAVLGVALFGNSLVARISPDGLFAPAICKSIIPWGDVQSVSIVSAYGSECAQVILVPGSRSERAITAYAASLSAVGRAEGTEGHSIPLGTSGISGDAFLAAVREAQSASGTRLPGARGRARSGPVGAGLQPSFGRRG